MGKKISFSVAIAIIIIVAIVLLLILNRQYLSTFNISEIIFHNGNTNSLNLPPKTNISLEDRKKWHEILKWPKECSLAYTEDFDNSLNFYEIYPKKYLAEILCEVYAYQGGWMYMFFDENQNPPAQKLLLFDTFDKTTNSITAGSTMLVGVPMGAAAQSKELTMFIKYRGIGDCGEIKTYRFNEDGNPILKEYKAEECSESVAGNFISTDKWPLIYQEK